MSNVHKCQIAKSFSIDFDCPYDDPDCDKCGLFSVSNQKVETFVKLPSGDAETKYSEMTEEQMIFSLSFIVNQHHFKNTQNMAFAMETFVGALENGLYPPQWVLHAVSGVFKKYLDGSNRPLSDLLGSGPGKNLLTEMENYKHRQDVKFRIEQYYSKGFSGKPNRKGDDAVTRVATEDGANADTYYKYSKEKTPMEKLNRAFYKSTKKKGG